MEEEELIVENIVLVDFAIVNSSGDILRMGQCPEDEASLQAETGETVLLNPPAGVTDATHYYKNGLYKTYPAQPTTAHTFDYTTEAWVDTRSADKNLDFDISDYTVQPTITVSGNTLSYPTFTATRNNGIYSESKSRTAGTVTFPGSPVLVAYNWDANTITTYADFATLHAGPRRFLLGEFRASGFFIPAANLVNGATVAANTVGTSQLAPASATKDILAPRSVIPSKLAEIDLTNMVPDDQMIDPDSWYGSITSGVNAYDPAGGGIFELRNPAQLASIQSTGEAVYYHARNTIGDVSLNSSSMTVEPFTELFVSLQAVRSGGTKMRFVVYAYFYDVNMGHLTAGSPVGVLAANGTTNTSVPFTASVIVPAAARFMRYQIRVIRADTDASIIFGAPIVRRMHNTNMIVDRAISDIRYAAANATTNIATLNFTVSFNSKLLIIAHVNPTTLGGLFDLIVQRNGVQIYKDSWLASTSINHASAENSFFRYLEVFPGAISVVLEGPTNKATGVTKGITVLEAKK